MTSSLGSCPGGHQSCCINGLWQATVFLNELDLGAEARERGDPSAPPPPINRGGLLNAEGGRVTYRVEVEIFGLQREGLNQRPVPGPLGRRQIFFFPAELINP